MTTIAPYPLQWPAGRPRRAAPQRKAGRFVSIDKSAGWGRAKNLTVAEALSRLQIELDRIGARYPVVSSNMETRIDGLPRPGQREPGDSGVAVYFQLAGKPTCLPCDTYKLVAHNIAAIAAHIESTRAIERHGVATVAEMFSGFTQLPPPGAKRPWWVVLEVDQRAPREVVEDSFRLLARLRHPDSGGSDAAMAELNAARDEATKERADG